MGWAPSYQSEARIYAQYLLQHHPQGTIGILYQNDDYGRDYLKGLKDGLSGKMRVIAEAPYESQDTTVDSQIVLLKSSGADIFFDVSLGKFSSQAIRKVAEIGWKPVHLLNIVSTSVAAVLRPAGFDNSKGILSTGYLKDPNDPTWADDLGVQEWKRFLDDYYPDADRANNFIVYAYTVAQTLVQVLKQCGDDLTRENVMRQAANLKDLRFELMRPGITINTSPTDFAPIKQLQMQRFNGERWEPFGPVINGGVGGT
jgi:branched-chain amino acid transport system substrate-binding protein